MNGFRLAARSLFRKGRGNVIKIISLGLGLVVGLVLITKVFFEYNYESFYPDAGRIHQVVCDYITGQGDAREENRGHDTTPGGVVVDMAREIPQIEAATRYTHIGEGGAVKLLNAAREVVDASVILADSCLHDVLPRPMIAGDAKMALSTPRTAIVSRSLAEKLGGGIGQAIEFDEYPDLSVVVGGIFEDIPENSDFRYDMAISLTSIGDFMWDGSMNWVGNDRYSSFLKLRPDADTDLMTSLMRSVQERHGMLDMLEEAGVDIRYRLVPLLKVHSDNPYIRQANLLMLLLAVSLIVIALLNYLIITFSTVIGRAREIAVYKCYGAGGSEISRQVLAETVLHLALSLAVAAILVAVFVDQIHEILRTSLVALLSWQSVLIVAGVCLVLLAVVTYIPLRLFMRIPAASVFRNFSRSRKGWKLALLFVQFTFAAAFLAILVVIWRQYSMITTIDPGYKYENIVYTNVAGATQGQRDVAIESLRAMPGVEAVSVSDEMPFTADSGNSITLLGDDRELFNVVDLYQADENWIDMMEIPIIEGRGFERGVTDPTGDSEMIVDRRFAERLSEVAGWDDGVVGKTVILTQHDERTIIGVYENFVIGSVAYSDGRPSVLGYSEEYETYAMDYLQVRLGEVNGETMRAVKETIESAIPDKDIRVDAMKNTIAGLYYNEKIERNAIILCSAIMLLIVLLGLVGYLRNEIGRRRAEIAIRKINGASSGDVIRLLLTEILYISVPALAAGSVAAYFVAGKWIQGFSQQIALSPVIFAASGMAVLAIILAVTLAVTYGVSVQNPVDSLKKD
jgi:putative ABC transport system permease protein